MATVISFSGLVGTGKSVCARYVGSNLFNQGQPVYYLRFRQVSVKSFFEKKRQITKFKLKKDFPKPTANGAVKRFENFRLRSNIFFVFFLFFYLLKAYLFHLLIRARYANDIVVVDRYIYDHLVHYQLERRNFWGIYRFFFRLLPQPDLPFVLYADFRTVIEARPSYDADYIHRNLDNYRLLTEINPDTILIDSNEIEEKMLLAFSNVNAYLSKHNSGG